MASHGTLVRAVLWRRLGARALDSFYAGVSAYLPVALLVLVVAVTGFDPFASGDTFGSLWLLVCAMGVIAAVLFETWMLSSLGRTPGKGALKIRVVSADNGAPTGQQALVRSALPVVAAAIGALIGVAVSMILPGTRMGGSGVLVVAGVGIASWLLIHLSPIWDRERRGWHDKAAGTSVVQDVPHAWRRTDDAANQRWRQLNRPEPLPHPPSRPLHPHNPHLTSIGTSQGDSSPRLPVTSIRR